MRDTFIFYRDWLNALNDMPDNIQLEVYKSIAKYALDGTLAELSPLAKIAFSFVKPQIDRDIDKYNKVVERNRANGKRGGRKPKKTKRTQINPKNPVGYLGTQKTQVNPKNLDNDNDNVNDNDNTIITPTSSRNNSMGTTNTTTGNDGGLQVYSSYIEESKCDGYWMEVMCMNFHLTIHQVTSYMDEFRQDCLCRGVDDRYKTLQDFKQHFNNWLRIKTEKERQNHGNRQSNGAAATREQRQAEAAQLVAEILARDNK